MVPDRLRNRMARTRRRPSDLASLRDRVLREQELCAGLSSDEIEAITSTLPTREVGKGEVLYHPGETGESLFVIQSGRVHVYRLAEDIRKLTVANLEPGDAFGDLALIGESMGGSFAEASEPTTLYTLTSEALIAIMEQNAKVAVSLVHLLSRRLEEFEIRLQDVAFRTVPARLAALLLRLADDEDNVAGLSHQELAEMVGTSRETVSRALLDFKAAGWVDIGRRSVRIRNVDALHSALTSTPTQN